MWFNNTIKSGSISKNLRGTLWKIEATIIYIVQGNYFSEFYFMQSANP